MVFPLGDSQRTRVVPVATYTMIALNVLAFLVQVLRGPTFTASFAATPWEITHRYDIPAPIALSSFEAPSQPANADQAALPQGPVPFPIWLTLLTSLFLHENPLHLVGNMLFLWIFGDNVEEVLGALRYVIVYVVAGLAGTLLMIAAAPNSLVSTLGASGAIAGIMSAYLIWFPYHRIRVFVVRRVLEVPALIVIGAWMVIQVVNGLLSIGHLGEAGGIAYLAHVGGLGVGAAAGLVFRRRARALGLPSWGWLSHF
jgi:membrane associated rhomboid family serine protease